MLCIADMPHVDVVQVIFCYNPHSANAHRSHGAASDPKHLITFLFCFCQGMVGNKIFSAIPHVC